VKPAEDLFHGLVGLRKEGHTEDALRKLRAGLPSGGLAPEEFERAGRFLATTRTGRERDLRVRVLAQCTSSWLASVLEAESFGRVE
jgi:hypothetical protein